MMNFPVVNLINDKLGTKQVTLGPCFTAMFLGFFVPLYRKDWLGVAYLLGGAIVFSFLFPSFIFIFNIGMGSAYNFIYVRTLINKDYRPVSYEDEAILIKNKINF